MSKPAFPPSVLIHGVEPGIDLVRTKEEVNSAGLDPCHVGFEVDIIGTRDDGLCICSRNRAFREPVGQAIESFRSAGFGGLMFLDLTHRRELEQLMQWVVSFGDNEIVISPCMMSEFFRRPDLSHHYKFDRTFDYKRLVILAQYREYVQAHVGKANTLQWEPLPGSEWRTGWLELAKQFDRIVYKLPWTTFNAKFDRQLCLHDDLRFFQEHGLLERIIPFGSLDNIKRLLDVWDSVFS